MSPEFITGAVDTLGKTYGQEHVRVAREGSQTLVRIDAVELYPSCTPTTTAMLVVLDRAQPRPQVYVQQGVQLAGGRAPSSTSDQIVGGEPWLQFSFTFPWEERHGIASFIAAARQRFLLDA
jgi:hypothetical protein